MQQWEYKICQIACNSGEGLEEAMNQLGAEGWELLKLADVDGYHDDNKPSFSAVHCLFKRPYVTQQGRGLFPLSQVAFSEAEPGERT